LGPKLIVAAIAANCARDEAPPKEDFDVAAAVHRCHCNFRADGIRDLRNGHDLSKSTNLAYATIAAAFLAAAFATPAFAALANTYVSAKGSDADTCAITARCVTMANVVTQTATNGVLHCLDSNDYFPGATLTTSITVDCSGTNAVTGTFTINAAIARNVHGKSLITLILAPPVSTSSKAPPSPCRTAMLRQYPRHFVRAISNAEQYVTRSDQCIVRLALGRGRGYRSAWRYGASP
jgi:hypothetical protein